MNYTCKFVCGHTGTHIHTYILKGLYEEMNSYVCEYRMTYIVYHLYDIICQVNVYSRWLCKRKF